MTREKEVTIYDIANKLSISVATVSRALKDDPVVSKKTRKKIAALAEELGYRSNNFARNLRIQKTNTIGVVIPVVNSSFQSTVIAGIESVANREGYTLIISQSLEMADKEKASVKALFNNRVDGLLISLAHETEDTSHFDLFFRKNIPVIFFDRVLDHPNCTKIVIDNRKAAFEATSHLIEQGCKRIVHITATPKRNVYSDRLQGYKDALSQAGLPLKKDQVIITDLSQETSGANAVAQILQMKPRPDGIFVANDNCAVNCILALKKAGLRIPEDIAVAGFNNDPVSRVVEPNLTTINYPGYQMGQAAAQHLINHLNGVNTLQITNSIVLRSELVIRASTLRKPQNDQK